MYYIAAGKPSKKKQKKTKDVTYPLQSQHQKQKVCKYKQHTHDDNDKMRNKREKLIDRFVVLCKETHIHTRYNTTVSKYRIKISKVVSNTAVVYNTTAAQSSSELENNTKSQKSEKCQKKTLETRERRLSKNPFHFFFCCSSC